MPPSIAIVGLGCVYPDARTPAELWENSLAQRRSFRRLPGERLRAEDYWSSDPAAPDSTYAVEGAVIANYEFDRVGFRVVGSTFRSADLAHWLALDVASRALADAGFPNGEGLPRESTGVILGNTLTGEFSRANVLRLRWPYVRRVLESALAAKSWPTETRRELLEQIERDYKAPFPATGEESLAGGLSNTIAGRICNQFNLKGGGYTIDGACASSLLAVANGCAALVAGDLEVVLAGGVDLSLDPFELVGFAKTGALAHEEMRVYDRRSDGFWPGEGCGFAVLMRHEDALASGRRIYALIRGWGISSDGSGGITRPELEGQLMALRRAYKRAGFGIDTVACFEGHGTGTSVGDATELEVLSKARREAGSGAPPAAIGSIKANIGHTKAAAGIAGLLKSVMAAHTQVLPPATGCEEPHAQLTSHGSALRVLRQAEPWPADLPLRIGVSSMGFGGINTHLVIESPTSERRKLLGTRERLLSRSPQDAELFLLAGQTRGELSAQVDRILKVADGLSRAELTDLAAELQRTLHAGSVRAAIVAGKPAELAARMRLLHSWLESESEATRLSAAEGVFLGTACKSPRVAFLFPGQGSPAHLNGGLWRRRFEAADDVYARAALPDGDPISTRIMQPAIVAGSLAGLKLLAEFGIEASAAIGHSLGELSAMCWAGVLSEESALRIARARGAAMADLGSPTGAMLAIAAPAEPVESLLREKTVRIVGFNSPRQTVVAGEAEAVQSLAASAQAMGWQASLLPVSHAFHTELVAAAAPVLAEHLAREGFAPPKRAVISTITGCRLGQGEDLRALLVRQVTSPVRFTNALAALLDNSAGIETPELFIEVGPGAVLTGLVRDGTQMPVFPLDVGSSSLQGLLQTLGAAFALGVPVRHHVLFADRFTRPFDLGTKPKFFANPCELAPVMEAAPELARGNGVSKLTEPLPQERTPAHAVTGATMPLELVRQLVAERAELPVAAVTDSSRMLSDLHLNSISVGQLVSEAARRLGLPRIVGLTDFANATLAEMARALQELQANGNGAAVKDEDKQPAGVASWFESFSIELEDALPLKQGTASHRSSENSQWRLFAPQGHPLATPLRAWLSSLSGNGVVLCLPQLPDETILELMLEAGRAVTRLEAPARLVVVQHGWGAGGFARTLHLEAPGLITSVVNVPPDCPRAVDWIVAEALAAKGFVEVHYDRQGRRRVPCLRWLNPSSERAPAGSAERAAEPKKNKRPAKSSTNAGTWPIGPGDVLLVSGGGKGIAAECALALARATDARLALLGRAEPQSDSVLAENLERIAAAGIKWCYARADVTDAAAVRTAVAEIEAKLGPVTALLHGAGANQPQLIAGLTTEAFERTLAPKIWGARNLLAALQAERLRLFITFGSIIARTGLHGEADYATANEWLRVLTEEFQAQHPQCRCLALEWSVWSGIGMGERLGRVESLLQQGIVPLTPDEGVRLFLEAVRRQAPKVGVVISGRFGQPPTLRMQEPELPLRRFVERKRVHYPGVELVLDAELSHQTDPYLQDHVIQRQALLPAVMGLEAMAQTAMGLLGSTTPPSFEKVTLARPIAVPEQAALTIRLAALRRGPELVEVCLRSAETDFQVDHMRAFCRFGAAAHNGNGHGLPLLDSRASASAQIALDPAKDLYGGILFHRGRFCRLRGYRLLEAKQCVAEVAASDANHWFGAYLPGEFVLGDPAARDAALHAVQACIPHRRLLPTGIEQLTLRSLKPGPHIIRARQRSRSGDDFIFDLEVTDEAGDLLEHWQGLHLHAVEEIPASAQWAEGLVGPYLERRLEELAGGPEVRVAFEKNPPSNPSQIAKGRQARPRSDGTLKRTLVQTEQMWRRPDGKPVSSRSDNISAAHCQDFTIAIRSSRKTACDLETIVSRPLPVWRDLLGPAKCKLAERVGREFGEDFSVAATRLWSALECLKKAGVPPEAPLLLEGEDVASALKHSRRAADGWVLFRAGAIIIATGIVGLRGLESKLVVAAAVESAPVSEDITNAAKPIDHAVAGLA